MPCRCIPLAVALAAALSFPATVGAQENLTPAGANAQIGAPFDAASLESAIAGMRIFKARIATIATLETQYLARERRRSEIEQANEILIADHYTQESKVRDCIENRVRGRARASRQADSGAAHAHCGAFPKKPPAVVELEQIDKDGDALSDRIRAVERAADTDAARAAAVPVARFAQMRERLASYVSNPDAFQGQERDLLKSRKTIIEELHAR